MIIILFLTLGLNSCAKKEKKEEVKESETVEVKEVKPFFKLSLAQWSLHKQIRGGELSPLDFAQKASEFGFEGIEYVSQLYREELKKDKDPKIAMQNLLDTLKMKSEKYGVKNVNIMIDNEGDLAAANEKDRLQAVENHKKWIDAGAFLGCSTVRVNLRGSDDVDIWSKKSAISLRELAEYAKPKNLNVIVENHGGFSSNGVLLTNVMKVVNMDNCGTLPDFGNFCQTKDYGSINDVNCKEVYDIYKGVGEMMPYAKAVSAKSYDFDEDGNQPKIDYVKMLQIVKDAGYTGFIGVEYEGDNLTEVDGIFATKNLLLKANAELK